MFEKISKIINIIIKYLSLFGLSFIWLNYYLNNYKLSASFATVISAIIGLLLKLISTKRNKASALKTAEQQHVSEISNQLLFASSKENTDFFKRLLDTKFNDVIYKNNFFICNNTAFFPFYSNFLLTENDILTIYTSAKKQHIPYVYVFCVNYNEHAFKLSQAINDCSIVLLNEKDTYKKMFAPLKMFPKESATFKRTSKKLQFKEYLYLAFNKTQTRRYFFGAVIMVFFSLFTPFKIYYIVFSSIFFMFAIFSRYNQPFNSPDIDIFD